MKTLVIYYLIVINLIGIFIMGWDKHKAIKGEYRVPEKHLFLVALVGGAMGTSFGMFYFRHKTRHWYFRYGMPAIFLVQATLLYCFLWKIPL